MELFLPLPENLTELSAADIRAFIDENLSRIDRVVDGDTELIGDMSPAEVEAAMVSAVADIEAARDQLAVAEENEVTPEERQERLAAIRDRARAAADEGDPNEEPERQEPQPDNDPEPDAEPEPGVERTERETERETTERTVQASARVRDRQRPPAPARERQPAAAQRDHLLTAAGGVRGYQAGQPINRGELAEAIIRTARDMGQSTPAGDGQRITVAQMASGMPEDRHLAASADPNENLERIQRVVGDEALTAAGGLCAPVEVYYELADFGVTARPVRDALAAFTAARGGIRFAAPPTLANVSTAVGVVTAANDALGGTNAAKTCQRIVCPSFSEVDVNSIFHCITGGNLGARAYPEQVAQFEDLVMQLWARTAEQRLLDGISSASTAVTYTRQLGFADTLAAIITAAAGQRNRHRMDPNQPLQVGLPAWLLDAAAVDSDRTQFDVEWDIRAELGERNITPFFYLDGGTGASQMFGAQSAGALLRFPATVVAYLFAPGSFLWIDGGNLELGLVRDSTLNAQNDYQLFGESWENIAFVGVESLKLTIDFCATGALAASVTSTGC